MTARHTRVLSVLISAAASCALAPVFARAAEPATVAPAADASQQPYYAVLNQDNVYVRSGPSDVFYATAKLNKGQKVTVVGTRDPWVKIVPPEGSFCYVARAYVEKRGDGTVGRVTKNDLNVRAGSGLNGLKTTVLTSLSEGDDVKILGEQAEYFKIAPPPGAYLYVMKTYVDAAPEVASAAPPAVPAPASPAREPMASEPVPPAVTPPTPPSAPTPLAQATAAPSTPTPSPVAQAPVAPPKPAPAPVAPAPAPAAVAQAPAAPKPVVPAISQTPAPSTQPAEFAAVPAATTQPTAVAMAPTTQPAVAQIPADERFGDLEASFSEATKLPLDQQPLDRLQADYAALTNDPQLPSSMRRIADMRIATIKLRSDAARQYADARKLDSEAKARQQALVAEQVELQQKVKDQQVTVYTVLGTLRVSSLQQSGPTLYRITDPSTGRTLVYLRSNDPKYAGLLNGFIGVNGDVTEDTNLNLKVITPSSVATVDQAKVNTNITATIMPPSLLPKTATASAGQ